MTPQFKYAHKLSFYYLTHISIAHSIFCLKLITVHIFV